MTVDRIVVVGGSIAAVTAAEALRLEGFDGEVEILSREAVAPYTRVPLSKGALAGIESLDDIRLPAVSSDIDLRLGVHAEGLDLERRVVHTSEGDVAWDGLVIATGARARRLSANLDELVVRDYHDCIRLITYASQAHTVLVIGGGFLGMEIASTLLDLGKSVTVLDREPPLQRLLGRAVSARVREVATERGVRIHVEPEGLELLGEPGARPYGAVGANRRSYHADLVVSAVGDVPNIEWLGGIGWQLHRGVPVDSRCQVAPNIVAAGDVAWCTDRPAPHARIPSWTNAVDQARVAARQLVRPGEASRYTPAHYFWTEQFGLDLKVSGPLLADSELTVPHSWESSNEALLTWGPPDEPHRVLGWNSPLRAAQLKRMTASTGRTSPTSTPTIHRSTHDA